MDVGEGIRLKAIGIKPLIDLSLRKMAKSLGAESTEYRIIFLVNWHFQMLHMPSPFGGACSQISIILVGVASQTHKGFAPENAQFTARN